MGGNGIVGGGVAVALGPAYASKYLNDGKVTVCFFSDGASNEGWCHEAMNMASLWKLPIVFVCENNLFAATTPSYKSLANPEIHERAAAYSMPGLVADGKGASTNAQIAVIIGLVVSLIIFTIAGLPQVKWGELTAPATWMTGGITGLLRATTLLTFATGGATTVVSLAAEAVNPTHDIPRVIIISTLGVAILYAFMSIVAVGVLPIEQTAGQSLVNTARTVLPKPLFYLFIIGGAEMALASTLNNQLATATKPMLQATWDGWFPASWGKLSKWKTPVFYLVVLYIIGMVTIWTGMDIDAIGSLVLILGQFTAVFIAYSMTQLPKVIPDEWAKSPFHVNDGTLKFCAFLAFLTCILNFYLQCLGQPAWVVIGNVVMAAAALIYSFARYNTGKVTQVVSYEAA